MKLNMKREEIPPNISKERYGDYSYLEQITGSYEYGGSKGLVRIVWKPILQKFYEVNISSNNPNPLPHNTVVRRLMGFIDYFRGTYHGTTQQIGEQPLTEQQETIEVLDAVLVDILHLPPKHPQLQGQLYKGLEGKTYDGMRKIASRDVPQIGLGNSIIKRRG